MFQSTRNKGFAITFPNGYTVSVQWGPMNYCDCMDELPFPDPNAPTLTDFWSAPNAEAAVKTRNGTYSRGILASALGFDPRDDVAGWLYPHQIADLLSYVSKLPDD